ncbi:MAG: hypothetical protein ASARMPREDX12_001482 [Alectoria sarmentosa]|nr:MAG: hypothetical protein ASARMPREDX12_001482 [Alectoria sarmentosa]
MRRMWSYITLLLPIVAQISSAATLPHSLQLINNASPFPNGSHEYVKCLPRPNVTYPIADSPLKLDMTFGHHSFLSWVLTTYLQSVLIAIKPNAAHHPGVYIPDGYYYYHEPRHLGAVTVVPALYRNFTWSDLYLVLHGLAEYVVTAPHAYEMCIEINFEHGGFAGVIFIDWWTSDVPKKPNSHRVRDAEHRRRVELEF